MAVAVVTSFLQICDANGDPVSGAKVNVYSAGTTTPLSLYSDTGLSVGVANPIVCDSSGRHSMTYIATQTYKIVVTTSSGSALYTSDNIDPGVPVGAGALAIANGGTGATTAGQARTNLDVPSNATVTSIASDVATLQSSISAISGIPQGRLTLTTGTPVLSSDVTGTSSVYYTPYIGNQIPIWSGSAFVLTTFTELLLSLVANHVANTIYDCHVINDNSTIRLVTSPAWNTSTAGSGARGSGAGTAELTYQGGVLVNANSMTARYGSTTLTVPAKQGTYVGTIYIDATAGQVTFHTSYGQNRKAGVWNAYNRTPIILKSGDSTASWSYSTASFRASNNAPSSWSSNAFNVGSGTNCNGINVMCGLAEEPFLVDFYDKIATNANFAIGIGWNSVSATSGVTGATGSPSASNLSINPAKHINPPSLGLNTISSLENSTGGTAVTVLGTSTHLMLSVMYRG